MRLALLQILHSGRLLYEGLSLLGRLALMYVVAALASARFGTGSNRKDASNAWPAADARSTPGRYPSDGE
jgi:hypothetical protein